MSKVFVDEKITVISGGTDNHLLLLDVFGSLQLSGKEAEQILEAIGVSTNKNMIPFDTKKPLDPSGIRIGTAAITTRGFREKEAEKLAKIISAALKNPHNSALQSELKQEVFALCQQFPIPSQF